MGTRDRLDAADVVWQQQRLWSAVAGQLRRSIVIWRTATLGLALAAAVLTTLALDVAKLSTAGGKLLSALGAVLLAVTPLIRATMLAPARVQSWVRARSTSEGLKSAVYTYLTGTPPYHGADADKALLDRSDTILNRVGDLWSEAQSVTPDSTRRPEVPVLDAYIETRLLGQVRYYRKEAGDLRPRMRLLRSFEFGLTVVAAALGAAAAVFQWQRAGAWVAVATTMVAAVTAHIAAARYEYQVLTYLTTARRLESMLYAWQVASAQERADPARAHELVERCEQAILAENQGWMAEWSRSEQAAVPTPAPNSGG
jgi:SMODS and SLOG-associating 2TM effector domain 1/Protein of unknown function (DUF4231)